MTMGSDFRKKIKIEAGVSLKTEKIGRIIGHGNQNQVEEHFKKSSSVGHFDEQGCNHTRGMIRDYGFF